MADMTTRARPPHEQKLEQEHAIARGIAKRWRTRAQSFTVASSLSRAPVRRAHPSYGELFCLAVGLVVAGYVIGWVHATATFVGWL